MFELIRPGHQLRLHRQVEVCVVGIARRCILLGARRDPACSGIRWGIDFAGGTEIQVRFAEGGTVDEGKIRDVVQSVGVGEPSVVRFGDADSEPAVPDPLPGRVREDQGAAAERGRRPRSRRRSASRSDALRVDRVEYVGPKVGAELRRDGIKAMLIAFAADPRSTWASASRPSSRRAA